MTKKPKPLNIDATASSPKTSSPRKPRASDFDKVRKHLPEVYQREQLGRFIANGWTSAELAEYACSAYYGAGNKRPKPAAYRFVVERGADHELAVASLAAQRTPGYVRPEFDPPPQEYEWDDCHNPEYSAEIRSATYTLARACMRQYDDKLGRPRRGADHPVRKQLLKKCFRELHRADVFGVRTGARR